MPDAPDPQITAAAIQNAGSFATGMLGALIAWWRWGRNGDKRCERVCTSMVALADTLIAVITALGIDDPRVTPHIRQMETKMAEARAMLGVGE